MTYSRDKLTKYRVMRNASALAASLPHTRSLSKLHLQSLLKQYGKVIVKPSGGYGGAGVMSVSVKGTGYEVHYGRSRKTFSSLPLLYSYIKSKTGGLRYIVQRKIPLAKVKGRPFDIRVMVQRTKKSGWSVTGKLAKIAGPGYIVTNVARSKGRVAPLADAISSSNITGKSVKQLQSQIDRVSLRSAKQLQKYYRIDTVGLDIGLDAKGKAWIIEPNFKPDKSLFRKLRDKSMYRAVMSFYNRRYYR
ncbi:hypothetical protein DNH61_08340 [Paenibacillus sambharensis]|uniref:ATP-grasp domain-containing protein n=1 Tax=Paenibacillus sambharensis TaxID=1803190 RepID=A0A2W1LXA8_9BACL|nr:YheC/YheD family protein [Paenibacillus sambharensis]PZD96351.1 hypothetical protein DNH61_08340 [Paenibacillus sambharensis]